MCAAIFTDKVVYVPGVRVTVTSTLSPSAEILHKSSDISTLFRSYLTTEFAVIVTWEAVENKFPRSVKKGCFFIAA
jgi:hypothetical protein